MSPGQHAGHRLAERSLDRGRAHGDLVIQRFEPAKLAGIDLLFVSLPNGKSREPLAACHRR